jgi:hypothetical protein
VIKAVRKFKKNLDFLLNTCAIGTIFRRNSGELKAGKKGEIF